MKTFFPPFVAFAVFAVLVVMQSFVFPMHVGDMGKGTMHAFKACFYFCWPLYFITALLTQGLIIVPVWEGSMGRRSALGKFYVFIFTSLASLIFAAGIAYIIWDKANGMGHLLNMVFDLYFIQMFYWVMNFFVLLLFDVTIKAKPAAEPPVAEALA